MRQPRHDTRLALLLGALLILLGCLVATPRPPELAPLAEPELTARVPAPAPPAVAVAESIEQLREQITAVLEREGVPGVGLALVDENGLIWAGGVGVADLESQTPVTADTVFRVASITKSVVALGVMRLEQENRLDLDAPLAKTMPEVEIANRWADSDPITLAHALEHTAGFDEMRFNEYWAEAEDTRPIDALAINPRSRVARWRPGSRMSYANPGYTVAGHAIEQASGEAWDAYLEREVLRPLGMETAAFRRTAELGPRLATGYVAPGVAAEFRPLVHAPAGALLASPRELAGLVTLGLERGWPIVRPDAFDRIEASATPSYQGTDNNYGLGNYGDVLHRARGRGHDGGLPGFLSAYRYFPELGVGYVMLLNGTFSLRAYVEIRMLLFAYLARGRALPPLPPAPPEPDEAIAAAAGYYGYASPRVELVGFIERTLLGLTLRPATGGAELELPGGRVELVATGDGGLRLPHESGTSLRATRDADGRKLLAAGMGQFEARSAAWARACRTALLGAILAVHAGIVWGFGWLLIAGLRRVWGRRPRPGEAAVQLWPAIASLSFVALVSLAQVVFARDAFTDANTLSVGLCVASLVFPAMSSFAAVATLRGRHLELRLVTRLVPGAAALACFGLSLWLLANGVIGLRVWAW